MLAALILIPASAVSALGVWRACRARTLPWFAHGITLFLTGSAGAVVALLVAAFGGT